MVPLSRLLDASRLSVCIAIPNENRRTDIRLACHLLFPCFLYQSEFPTLLAMREIIASAICQSGFLPEPAAKLQILFVNKCCNEKKVINLWNIMPSELKNDLRKFYYLIFTFVTWIMKMCLHL